MIKKTHLFLSALSGLSLVFAFPPFGYGFIAYFSLVPLLFLIVSSRPRESFILAFVSGISFLGSSLCWLRHITWIGMVFAVIALAVFYAVPFWLSSFFYKISENASLIVLPFAAAGFEWLRSFDQLAFPWMLYGNSQACYPRLIQFADITSVYGVSFWVVSINIFIFLLLTRRKIGYIFTIVAMFALPFLYSSYVIDKNITGTEKLNILLVQGNILPNEKWDETLEEWNIDLYMTMTEESLKYKPDLVIWPETAIPVYAFEIPRYARKIHAFVDSIGVPLLSGVPSVDFDTDETYNSAALLIPGQKIVQRYSKIHLVPFGEAFPLDSYLKFLRKIDLGQANWNEGKEKVVFDTTLLPKFNVAICFESIFPDLIRSFIKKGSEMIVVITNDVWFGPYASPVQHAMISVMRAIEFHRPVARCANTGISMIIDPYGRIIERTNTFERTVLYGTVSPQKKMTFFAKYGNIFSMLCVIFTISAFYYLKRKTGRVRL